MRSSISGGMPGPVSDTVRTARPSTGLQLDGQLAVDRRVVEGVDEEIVHELLQLVAVAEDRLVALAEAGVDADAPLGELRLHQLQRLAGWGGEGPAGLRALAGPAQRGQPLEQPLQALDLAVRDAAEPLEPSAVVQALGDELDERLDGDEGVLDLVGEAGGQQS